MVCRSNRTQSVFPLAFRCTKRPQQRLSYPSARTLFYLAIVSCVVISRNAKPATAADQDSTPTAGTIANAEESERSRPETLKFRILKRDNGQPVAGAKIQMQMWNNKTRFTPTLTTDEDGRA